MDFEEPSEDRAARLTGLRSRWRRSVAAALAALRPERLGREMLAVLSWPELPGRDEEALLAHLLDHAAAILAAPRVLLVWEETDEPWLNIAHRARDAAAGLERLREPPTAFDRLVAEPLAGASFFAAAARGRRPPAVWRREGARASLWRGEPVAPELARRFAIGRVASWPFRAERVEGRLFALDRRAFGRDHLVLGEIVARRIGADLDRFHVARQVESGAVAEERLRLAWDLHDGLLQSLTGIAFQLQALARRLADDDDPAVARGELASIQRLIAADQRDLRFFIEELKPASASPTAGEADLSARFAELRERLDRLCGLSVEISQDGAPGELPAYLARQLYRLLREALFNVARHAGASAVRVEIRRGAHALEVTVTDNGRGFPFKGRFEHDELKRQKLGPVSLKERIGALGGSLAIDSADGRTRLEMSLPVVAGAVGAVR